MDQRQNARLKIKTLLDVAADVAAIAGDRAAEDAINVARRELEGEQPEPAAPGA